MPETHFDEWIAQHMEVLWPELYEPSFIDPSVDVLVELAGAGPALEFGVGTGRLALPLSRRGIRVHGIELSPPMAAELERHDAGAAVDVTIGDFATTKVDDSFTLVYLVRNTITNLTTQDEQIECFRNAAAHLKTGGCFVIENYIPALRLIPPGETSHLFHATPDHIGVGEYDFANQIEISRHWWLVDGELRTFESPFRYVWPAELDLMARLAGLTLRDRWSDWHRGPFTSESRSHVSVWEKRSA